MKMLTASECSLISGMGSASDLYMQMVAQDIAKAMLANKYKCNVNDLTKDVIASALTGGVTGAFGAGVVVPGVGIVPGWLIGAASGAGMAAFTYGVSCWW